jgi:membrane-associated phospholipid phosphatase
VKAKGAKAQTKMVAGRKVHYVTGSADDNGWITWIKGGVVLASSEAALADALDPKTAKLGGDLAALAAQTDHGRMVWAAGVVSPAALAALGAPSGSVAQPLALRAGVDIAADTDVDIVLGGSTPSGAAALADGLRALLAPMRSAPNTAPLFAGLRLGVHGSDVHVTARLDADITRRLIDAVNIK